MKEALAVIDIQNGFMPIEVEGDGRGELPVTGGPEIIAPVNKLIGAYAAKGALIFTTQDWHPVGTAHFSDTPNYDTNWPEHCVADTQGAMIDERVDLPDSAVQFIKGFELLTDGEDDTSYSGYNGIEVPTGVGLPERLKADAIEQVTVVGLALDYCVAATALDIRRKMGIAVRVAIDATRGISEERTKGILEEFAEAGVQLVTSDDVIRELEIGHE